MAYKSLNFQYVIRLLLFALFVSSATITAYTSQWVYFSACLTGILIIIAEFINYANSINRKIAFFFDAVRNDDTTLHFPEKIKNKSLKHLHFSLNNLNNHISELKIKNENEVRFYQEMLKFSATGILAVTENETVEVINNSALQLIGMSHIWHLKSLKQKNEELYNALTKIKPSETLTLKILSGEELKVISIKVAVFSFYNKKFRIYSLYNIKSEIEENELDSWQKLIRVITHEIMNSIAPITSLSTTLAKFLSINGKPKEIPEVTNKDIENVLRGLDVIEVTSKSLTHFVNDYRRLTKIPKPVFLPIAIDDWLQRIIDLYSPKFEEQKIELKYLQTIKSKTFNGDEKLLTQVMLNLLNNAIDAMATQEQKQLIIKVAESPEGFNKISITDNGSGIEQEEIEKIFIPFYTTKEHGSGIGLSLARQIMRLHKGNITAYSVPGKNTTFTLNF